MPSSKELLFRQLFATRHQKAETHYHHTLCWMGFTVSGPDAQCQGTESIYSLTPASPAERVFIPFQPALCPFKRQIQQLLLLRAHKHTEPNALPWLWCSSPAPGASLGSRCPRGELWPSSSSSQHHPASPSNIQHHPAAPSITQQLPAAPSIIQQLPAAPSSSHPAGWEKPCRRRPLCTARKSCTRKLEFIRVIIDANKLW